MIQVTCLFQQSRPNIYSDAINSSKFLLVSLLVDCISAGKLTKNTIPHRWIMVLKWGTADVTPLTGAKSNKSTRPIQMLCLADMLAFICHFKATRQTWITVFCARVQDVTSMGLAQSPCVCVYYCSHATYPPFHLHFTHWAVADTTGAPMSTSGAPLVFLLISLIFLLLSALQLFHDETHLLQSQSHTPNNVNHTYVSISATHTSSFHLINLIEFSLRWIV